MPVTSTIRKLCAWALACVAMSAIAQSDTDKRTAAAPADSASQQTLQLPPSTGDVTAGSGSITFIGNATVLIRYAGLTILTDPNFLHKGEHVHLGYGLTSQRLTDPAIALDKLPPIDLIVLSHYHGDHFDQLVQQKLDRNIPIVTTPDAVKQLAELGFRQRYALQTWQSLLVKKGPATLQVTAAPGRHGPPLVSGALPDVMGSLLEFNAANGKPYRMYVSGDTMVYDDIHEIPKRYPDIDLALLHLGGTRVLGVTVTMDAAEGVRMLQIVAPQHAIPIHYNDYDVFKSPLGDFEQAVRKAGLQDKVSYLKHGESYQFQPGPR